MKFSPAVLLLTLLPVACHESNSSKTNGIGTNREYQPMTVLKHYTLDSDFVDAIEYISNAQAKIYVADVKKLDGNVETAIYAATEDEARVVATNQVVKLDANYTGSLDPVALCMYEKTDACDLNWENDAFTLIDKKRGTTFRITPIVNNKREEVTISTSQDGKSVTMTFENESVSINRLEQDMDEYGAGAKLANGDAFEFNSYSAGKDKTKVVTIKELCEAGQISIWNDSGDNLLGAEAYPASEFTKDCSQPKTITLKIAEASKYVFQDYYFVGGRLLKFRP
ncbi:MAG TPA: hypothetical protein VFO10_03140 [Oligoflexus sp.]|uniref:hypothetical protein n=1 Tax=Oligoflexus sp. TaxID=1971216 RepID=UPI002D7F1DD8|nr:hypothetical protein [Oligoflexus sp.]HET9236219.1 hypothetical protein [Oligoflexus sp.]